jgi:hypothetical protein
MTTIFQDSLPNNEGEDILQFCINTITKEAREEDRLVKQIFNTMLSAYTNNPINLAINSPTGEGKSYVIQKVGEKFPTEDVMFLAGMTDKALFHRSGALIVKNENGEYESLDDKIADIDSQIQDKKLEISMTKNDITKEGLEAYIKSLEKDKEELQKNVKKLIDLSHKVLVFLDSPRPDLFAALMPLLSHDRYEVEYEFVDTHNGIKTRTNIMKGWPAVIFAQAIDYSHYARYPEIQRRFIITNPKMEKTKYAAAVDLICDKFGLPDFAYQAKIVSDKDKQKTKEVTKEIIQRIKDVCNGVEPGKNNVIIPYYDVLKQLLPKDKAFDMTTANRLGAFLSLLPLINIDKRPRLFQKLDTYPFLRTTPFALFEDLQETMFLMEYANGVRPYILEWYYNVFLPEYNKKTKPDTKIDSRGDMREEEIIAVTSGELIEKTKEVYGKTFNTQKLTETYLYPLLNENYIDKTKSVIDHRSNLYTPVVSTKENKKLFVFDETNNLLQQPRVVLKDLTQYPDKQYLISKIQEVLRYSSDNRLLIEIRDHNDRPMAIEELIEQYYPNPSDYFSSTENKSQVQQVFPEEYRENNDITRESNGNTIDNVGNTMTEGEISNKIFDSDETNNFIYSDTYRQTYEHLIQEQNLPTIGLYYVCKEHPDVWDKDLRGLVESHFKHRHSKD